MIFVILFVLYFLTLISWFALVTFVVGIFKADDTFVRVMTILGTALFLVASVGMTLISLAGTIVAIENGFYL